MIIFSKEDEEVIARVLDRGSWKHSWHIKRRESGYIDAYDVPNLDKMLEIVDGELDYAIDCLILARKAKTILERQKKNVLDDMAEQEALSEEE